MATLATIICSLAAAFFAITYLKVAIALRRGIVRDDPAIGPTMGLVACAAALFTIAARLG